MNFLRVNHYTIPILGLYTSMPTEVNNWPMQLNAVPKRNQASFYIRCVSLTLLVCQFIQNLKLQYIFAFVVHLSWAQVSFELCRSLYTLASVHAATSQTPADSIRVCDIGNTSVAISCTDGSKTELANVANFGGQIAFYSLREFAFVGLLVCSESQALVFIQKYYVFALVGHCHLLWRIRIAGIHVGLCILWGSYTKKLATSQIPAALSGICDVGNSSVAAEVNNWGIQQESCKRKGEC